MMRLASEQLLLASATSEAGIGGDVRSSACAVEAVGDRFKLEKNATVISYGAHADGILVTARRNPDSPPSDQVIAAVLARDYQLEATTGWDTLGMRGTCSNGYRLRATGGIEQILPLSYADISARTMLPVSHLTWSSLWLGIATDAVTRAQGFVRAAARKKPAVMPPGALRLAEAVSMLQLTKANVVAALKRYEAALEDVDELSSLSFAVMMNNLKTGTSQMAIEVINAALLTCGIAGYKNDTRLQRRPPPARRVFRTSDGQQRSHLHQYGQPAPGPQARHQAPGLIMDTQSSFQDELFARGILIPSGGGWALRPQRDL